MATTSGWRRSTPLLPLHGHRKIIDQGIGAVVKTHGPCNRPSKARHRMSDCDPHVDSNLYSVVRYSSSLVVIFRTNLKLSCALWVQGVFTPNQPTMPGKNGRRDSGGNSTCLRRKQYPSSVARKRDLCGLRSTLGTLRSYATQGSFV